LLQSDAYFTQRVKKLGGGGINWHSADVVLWRILCN